MHRKEKSSGISAEVLCAEYEAVYRYVLTLCRDESEAQDITQETFLRALNGADGFQGRSSLYTWLCAIGKNLWINRCRKQKREISGESVFETLRESGSPPEQLLLEKDAAMQVHRVLHGLQEPYKEVFSLRMFGQLSFGEIAELFSRTESWARVTYHRARAMIRERLRKDGYDEA